MCDQLREPVDIPASQFPDRFFFKMFVAVTPVHHQFAARNNAVHFKQVLPVLPATDRFTGRFLHSYQPVTAADGLVCLTEVIEYDLPGICSLQRWYLADIF